jgi:hypothetical protein
VSFHGHNVGNVGNTKSESAGEDQPTDSQPQICFDFCAREVG